MAGATLEIPMFYAAMFFLVLAAAGLVLLLVQFIAVLLHVRRAPATTSATPGISILKPLCGIDDDLEKNLECFAQLDYPNYEVVLGVRTVDDPAYPVAKAAVARWPNKVRLVIQQGEPGYNPKVNQLITLEKTVRFDLLVISDSNTRVAKDYLREVAAHFQDPMVACVSHPIVGAGQKRLGSLMDNLHLASSVGAGMIGAKAVGKDLVVGKSMVLRRQDLAQIGGFVAFKDCLGEDYAIGIRIRKDLKKKVVIARNVVVNVSENRSVLDFIRRYGRWSIIHRSCIEFATYLGQSMLHPFGLGLVAVMLYPSRLTLLSWAAIGVLKTAVDVLSARSLSPGFGLVAFLSVPFKDLLLFGAWINGLFQTTLSWRGNILRVTAGSRLVPLEEAEEEPGRAA